ncbi:Acetyltransferase involved in cellulose biosynthesis, CelD/BcsL family [Methylobacterium sp. 174MFSha1.1]|uniref:lipid II:glycine glycyltransferase FemX n=1 Tax=Methylobacterium sp. 174MFSha1.1 TaxID=1502749 RepID=UPI0008DFA97F|nr:GNAT family N-acetyltransferase [Methylobacterium sp. 174MFSha1.1]SFV10387.1 Acetyltransferase involved in cellulose biosynthesis, CelD/BcsL family [Methylobacterium sp. 174MFSha1.1]
MTNPETGLRVQPVIDAPNWDEAVWAQPRGNIFSAAGWGTYKARRGAGVERLSVLDEAGDLLGLAQVQSRRRGPARQFYLQGGPLLTEKGERHGEAVVRALLAHLALGPLDLLVVDFNRAESPGAVLGLLATGFRPVAKASRHTLEVDLTRGLDALQAEMEQRWRKALRKAERNAALTVRFLDEPAERLKAFDAFAAMYAALKTRKGFSNDFDPAAYRDLAANDPRHVMLEVREGDELCLVRIAHVSRDRFSDFFTASTERAKTNAAAYLAVWSFIRRGAEEGCRVFDFGGIDPAHNRGVYDFKRGLTRNVASSGPLWLYGRNRLVTAAAGAVLAR